MLKILELHISEFRGIRNFRHSIGGENLGIKGANGSGKSGIVDAIEFAFTGNITRLTGIGSAVVSIRGHAPHVDCKNNPEKSKVTLRVSLADGLIFTLERSVATPTKPILTPDTKETRAAIDFMVWHPEFSLSRREILKFVLTEPGKRAKEIQTLLKLDIIDKNRVAFQTSLNTTSREEKTAALNMSSVRTNLLTHLKISELSNDLLLVAINERRTLLGLNAFTEFTADIKCSDGITSESRGAKISIPRTDSIAKVVKCIEFLNGSVKKNSIGIKLGLDSIQKLKNEPVLLSSLSRQSLFEEGLSLTIDDSCPLCDHEWDRAELLLHLREKIKKNEEAAKIKSAIENAMYEQVGKIRSFGSECEQFRIYASALGLDSESDLLLELQTSLRQTENMLVHTFENIEVLEKVLRNPAACVANSMLPIFEKLKAELEKLPDLSAKEAAKQYLFIADERLANHFKTKREHDLLKKLKTIAESLLNNFTEVSEASLTALYNEVQNDFILFYRRLNKEDENNFSALLKPQEGALNFEVDFYGRGQFPPNAYHSEGHQDSMGLCLYFALTKKLLGQSFSLCLLDDVLMSVDMEHRREVCKLLLAEFPNTQFIITTHDEVWSKQLTLEGLIKSRNLLQFRKWTVDDGPAAWDFGEVWKEIEVYIDANNISAASQSLRKYLEFLMAELAFKLRASVEARPVSNYDLGELMSAVAGRFKSLLQKAKKAANSWNQQDIVEQVAILDTDFGRKYAATNTEQWAINAMVHYNEWINLSRNDFAAVVKSFYELIGLLKCSQCDAFFYTTPTKGTPDALRCDCSKTLFNLRNK